MYMRINSIPNHQMYTLPFVCIFRRTRMRLQLWYNLVAINCIGFIYAESAKGKFRHVKPME